MHGVAFRYAPTYLLDATVPLSALIIIIIIIIIINDNL